MSENLIRLAAENDPRLAGKDLPYVPVAVPQGEAPPVRRRSSIVLGYSNVQGRLAVRNSDGLAHFHAGERRQSISSGESKTRPVPSKGRRMSAGYVYEYTVGGA